MAATTKVNVSKPITNNRHPRISPVGIDASRLCKLTAPLRSGNHEASQGRADKIGELGGNLHERVARLDLFFADDHRYDGGAGRDEEGIEQAECQRGKDIFEKSEWCLREQVSLSEWSR